MDQIKLLLATTGLSADDLIKQLSEYKALEQKQDTQIETSTEANIIEEEPVNSLLFQNKQSEESLNTTENNEENVAEKLECASAVTENVPVGNSEHHDEIFCAQDNVVNLKESETEEISQDSFVTAEDVMQECIEISQENEPFLTEDVNFKVIDGTVSQDCVEKGNPKESQTVLETSEDITRNVDSSQQETNSTFIIEDASEETLQMAKDEVENSNCSIKEENQIEEISFNLEEIVQPIISKSNNKTSEDSTENSMECEEDKVAIEEIDVSESIEDSINNDYVVEECGDSDEDNTKDSITSIEEKNQATESICIENMNDKSIDVNITDVSQNSIPICIEDCDLNLDKENCEEEISQCSNYEEKTELNVSESTKISNEIQTLSEENIAKDVPNCINLDINSVEQRNICKEISTEDDLEEEAIVIEEIEVECNENSSRKKLLNVHSENTECNTDENGSDLNLNTEDLEEKSTSAIPSTSRLKMTSLIEERLNSEKTTPNSESDFIDLSKDDIKLSFTESVDNCSEVKRQPILGYIRKSQSTDIRKRIRTSKPPWLIEQSDEESNSSIPSEVKVDNMRAEIFNQLKQLRQKKEPEPLVDIVNPIPRLYIKRTSKKVDKADGCETHLGLKISNVQGGYHDIEDVKLIPETIKSLDCKIINENLETNVITLTKTMDYKKIKGWQNKKLLIEKAEDIPQIIPTPKESDGGRTSTIKEDYTYDDGPSCSYSLPKKMTKQIVENNVFASNNLDGFLDEQKDLNISYDVPNLTSSTNVDFLDSTVIPNPQNEVTQDNKRRFKMAETEDTNCINQNARSDPYKPRTLAEKRKLMELAEKPSNKKMKQDKCEDVPTLTLEESIPPNLIYSSVYYRGRRYKVPSSSFKSTHIDNRVKKKPRKQYKYVEVKRNLKKKFGESVENTCEKRKPSIYLKKLQSRPNLTYKPGPLCKKVSLQNATSAKWKTVIKQLPKIYLEIYPHLGKKLHPRVQQVINFDSFDISEERLEFALTALSSEPPKSPIKILVPYKHNQESILLQQPVLEKREIPDLINIKDIKPEETSIFDSVQSILNDLITCIENKEIENDIIKDDPDVISKEETIQTDVKPKQKVSRAEVIKGTSKKTSLELKRLNVKFIEVNIDGTEHKPAFCSKPYCHLGCVCKSLSSVPIPPDHCGEAKCIFVCHCGFDKKKTDSLKFVVPPGTDILSERTVSRLEDEAKKNLAKVEKEFTQTVIHAYNQTIVVGENTNRKRRATKVPKKYEDYLEPQIFVENHEEMEEEEEDILITPIESPKSPSSPIPQQNKECYIKLLNLDLKHLMPYCLEHNLYNCHCNFEAEYTKLPCLDKTLDVQPKKVINKRPKPIFVDLKRSTRETKKPARYERTLTEKSNCARTKGAPTSYYTVRNRSAVFRQKLSKKLKIENDKLSINLKQWLEQGEDTKNEETSNEITFKKPDITLELKTDLTYDPLLEPIGVSSVGANKPSRRKQHLQVREETSIIPNNPKPQTIEPALQRRKKAPKKQEDILNTNSPIETSGSILKNISPNDMLTPNPSLAKKFSEMLSDTGPCNQFRLIQWSTIIKIYEQKLIEIWFAQIQNKMKFIVTDFDKKSVIGYRSVRQFEEYKCKKKFKIDLIRWIVTRSAPGGNGDDLLVILKMRPTFLEICGICSKNSNRKLKIDSITDNNSLVNEERPANKNKEKNIDQNLIVNRPFEITPVESQLIKVIPPQINVTPITNEEKRDKVDIPASAKIPNEFKTVQQVIFSKGDFIQKRLVPIETNGKNMITIHCLAPNTMDAALPNVPICKWRMLKVNSNFSILSFKRNQFRIKCSDIITVMKVSQRIGKTIIINTDDISLNYAHKLFGIYIVPNYADKIFIGPYFCYENHDLETLRFVNNVLVNTEVFNKMQKSGPQITTGVWYQQLIKKEKQIEKTPSVIDLTEADDSCKKNDKKYVSEGVQKKTTNSPRSILKTSFLNANLSSSATLAPIIEMSEDEKLYIVKLKEAMKLLNLNVPENAVPISFKVNFDNGLIYGYKFKDKGHIYVYWPGSLASVSCKIFRNMDVAIEWLQLKLKSVFILVPTTFEIKVELVDKKEFLTIKSKGTISSKYFKDVYVIGKFGILKMIEVAEYLQKNPHLSSDHKAANDQLKLQTESNDFKAAIIQFLDNDVTQYMEFLNKIKVQMSSELRKCQRLCKIRTSLEIKKHELLKTHTALLKQADDKIKAKLNQEFMKNWVNPKSTSKLEKIKSDDVICLDSDEEDKNSNNMTKSKVADKNSNNENGVNKNSNTARSIKAKITKSNCKLKITSMDVFNRIDSKKKEEIEPIELKRKLSSESITLSSKKIKMLDDLFVESKTKAHTNCTDVEKIDLSHISVDKVRSLLGANIRGNRLTLTQAQLNSLKALSDRNKCKWLSVSQDNSVSEENKGESS